MIDAINDVKNSNANCYLYDHLDIHQDVTPVLEIVPSHDMLFSENANVIIYARNQGIKVALFPSPNSDQDIDTWWAEAPRDFPWWVVWFEQYEKFIYHHAVMASNYGAEAIILGGPWVQPALPNGALMDGSMSNVPEDALSRWLGIIEGIRQRFGTVLWASEYPSGIDDPPAFMNVVDGIYLIFSAQLSAAPDNGFDILRAEALSVLDNKILPFQQEQNKPVIIAAAYPSANGGITGCIPDTHGNCINLSQLDPGNPDIPEIILDLDEQTEVYNALLAAVNERDWVAGFVSEGYYPPVPLLDKSVSIHGKPANGTLWYWYPKMLGK
jgi:hypothetical protein